MKFRVLSGAPVWAARLFVVCAVVAFAAFSLSAVDDSVKAAETSAESVSESSVDLMSAISLDEEIAALLPLRAATRDVRCDSVGFKYRRCSTGVSGTVRLRVRHSSVACTRGTSWGTTSGGRYIWVNKGCQATFRVTYSGGSGGGWNSGNAYQRCINACNTSYRRCLSNGNSNNTCVRARNACYQRCKP